MDRLIAERKLESLRRCLNRIHDKCPATAEALQADIDAQDILVLNITRAVQTCVDIASHLLTDLEVPQPETMGQAFDCLAAAGIIDTHLAKRLKQAVGFRNIAVHAYDAINWNIVFAIATQHRQDFKNFARAIDSTLPANDL